MEMLSGHGTPLSTHPQPPAEGGAAYGAQLKGPSSSGNGATTCPCSQCHLKGLSSQKPGLLNSMSIIHSLSSQVHWPVCLSNAKRDFTEWADLLPQKLKASCSSAEQWLSAYVNKATC